MGIRFPTCTIGGALALTLAAGAAWAQQPNPLDVVPDAMPFDVPYGAPISLEAAEAAINAAVAEARRHNWKMNVAVVDSGGNLVAFKRMDGAQLASITISEHKARASAKFVQLASGFDAEVHVEKDGVKVGGTSIMGLMMLSAGPGTSITVSAAGPEAQAALTAISELVAAKFNEEGT